MKVCRAVRGSRWKDSYEGEFTNITCKRFGSEERAYLTGKWQVKGALDR